MTLRLATDEALVRSAYEQLSSLLPARWVLEYLPKTSGNNDVFVISDPGGITQRLRIDARRGTTPAELQRAYSTSMPVSEGQRDTTTVVVAPYLSPRSREVLAASDIGYFDLTGNALISLSEPGLTLRTNGAQRNPVPLARPDRGIAGRAAGRIIRALVENEPPYSVTDLAGLAEVSLGYCSRTLQALEREALVRRDGRGTTLSADWSGLLRRRGAAVPLFDPRRTTSWIARTGVATTLEAFSAIDPTTYAVTGSFAAARIRPVAAPIGLTVYAEQPEAVAETLDLLPATEGANVRLVVPGKAGEFTGTQVEDGRTWVAPSQLVIDCLGGPGRMPQEGEAVLQWMIENETDWRVSSIQEAI